jgi:hypothetical protein
MQMIKPTLCTAPMAILCFLGLLSTSWAAAPRIVSFGPPLRYVGVHGTYSFHVVARGNRLRYQWWNQESDARAGHAIPPSLPFGVNTPRLRVTDAQNTRDYNGWYWCVVTDGVTGESVTTPRAQCVVVDVPRIVDQPDSRTVAAGESVTFSVVADAGAPVPIKYQWLFNSRPIYGATQPTFTIPRARERREGLYSCRVKTMGGIKFSEVAVLTVQ